ncbi:MAG: TonB-dependent receptor [Pseudomonadota bacterium]
MKKLFTVSALSAALLTLGIDAIAQTTDSEDDNAGRVDEIVVSGIFEETDRLTGSAHRIDTITLEEFQYNDINRVLNLVPGVYSREEDGVGLRPNIGLRGGSADRSQKVALMEDGVLLSPAPYSAPAAYFFPLTARMVGVEVFKGPASIEFGPQTIGGAINLISAPVPSDMEGMLEFAGGSDGYRHLHARVGGATSFAGLSAELMHIGSDGFKQLDGGGDTGFEKTELVLKSALSIGPGDLQLRLTYADEVSDETYLGLTESDLRDDPLRRYRASALDRMEWDWIAGRADWSQPLWGGTLEATAYTQWFDRAWRKFNNFSNANIRDVLATPDSPFNQLFVSILQGADTDGLSGSSDDIRIGTNDRSFFSSGLQGSLSWGFGQNVRHSLRIGTRLHVDRVRRLHDEFGFEQLDGRLVENSQPRAILTDNTGYTEALSVWARDEISAGKWKIVPGLRLEYIANSFTDRIAAAKQDNDYAVVLPGVGVLYAVNEHVDALFGVHKGFSPAAPSLTDGLDFEESVNYEFGGRIRSDIGRFEAIAFLNDYSNLTAICTISAGCLPDELDSQTNAGEVRTQGLEFGWNHDFSIASDRFSMPVSVTYTLTDSEFQEAFSSTNPQFGEVEAGFELPYVPENRANLTIGLVAAKWRINMAVTYIDQMRDQAGTGEIPDGQGSDETTLVDLAADYQINQDWTVSGRIDNLADDVYVVSRRPFGARPGKPRSVQIMVKRVW